jgi:hypothetical protein
MVGTMRRIGVGQIADLAAFKAAHESLMNNKTYRGAILGSTASEDSVNARIMLATEAFKDVS